LHAKALMAQSPDAELPETLLRKACSLNDQAAEPHFQLGVVLQRERKFADAAREFEGAAARDPADSATHYHLAQVYDRLGKRDAAVAERERHARLMQAGRQ
jgi:tetratricopeptide (TPR) repeat protein